MKKHLIYSAIVLVAAIFSFGLINNTYAEDKPTVTISISPTRESADLKPGDSFTGSFRVASIGTAAFDYTISAKPFTVTDRNYSFNYGESNEFTNTEDWVVFDSTSGHLEPNSVDRIYYTIHVPHDATPGGHYIALLASTKGGEDAMINVESSVALIVYLTVEGEINRSGDIIENNIPQFYLTGPIHVDSLVKNTGNIQGEATYEVEIRNFFTNEIAYTNQENPATAIILPKTERFSTSNWDGAPALGIFKVRQTIKFLDKVSTEEKIVIICPLWLIFIIVFVIALLIVRAFSRKNSQNKASE